MSDLDSVLNGSLARAADLVRRGDVSATELVSASLARITHSRDSKFFLRMRGDAALAEARSIDELDREARLALPLCGVPFARKDLFSVPNEVTTFGAHKQFHRRGTTLAPALAALQAAGGIDLGALHMSEFAMGPSGWSSTDGAINNPLNGSLISGGSSSGSAVSVGGKLVFGALGTDTGGSSRIPAAFCGVVALKPSSGRISTDGALPVSKTLDTVGPFARSVEDCALLFDVLAGGKVSRRPDRKVRFAILDVDSLPVTPAPEMLAALQQVAALLEEAGYSVTRVRWPDFAETGLLSGTVFLAEAATAHLYNLVHHAELIGPQVRERLLQGLACPAPIYLSALNTRAERRERFETDILADADVMLLPVAPCSAPTRNRYSEFVDVGETLKLNSHLASYTGAFNYLDVPVLSMPATSRKFYNTLGIQVVARQGKDGDAFDAGLIIEKLLG